MRNLTPAQRRALLQALHEDDRDYYPYAPDRNPGGLIGTIAAILVFFALVTVTIFAIRSGVAQRILFPPAPVVVPTVQPTAAITVPTPRPFPTHPPYMPQPPAPAFVAQPTPIIIIATAEPCYAPLCHAPEGGGGNAGNWQPAENAPAPAAAPVATPMPEPGQPGFVESFTAPNRNQTCQFIGCLGNNVPPTPWPTSDLPQPGDPNFRDSFK